MKFISGEAPAILCPNTSPMAGSQPVSVFVIHIEPAFIVPPVTTTKAALMNATALLALAGLAVILSAMKKRENNFFSTFLAGSIVPVQDRALIKRLLPCLPFPKRQPDENVRRQQEEQGCKCIEYMY